MLISEVAARTGIPSTTLRFYESRGLVVAARAANGYREFDDTVVDRLTFIESAKEMNLTLAQITDLLLIVEEDSCTEVREAVQPRLEERLREVDRRLRALSVLRARLADAAERVAACPDRTAPCRSECMVVSARGHQEGGLLR